MSVVTDTVAVDISVHSDGPVDAAEISRFDSRAHRQAAAGRADPADRCVEYVTAETERARNRLAFAGDQQVVEVADGMPRPADIRARDSSY